MESQHFQQKDHVKVTALGEHEAATRRSLGVMKRVIGSKTERCSQKANYGRLC